METPSTIELTPEECRVLGVLIEKAQTTPAQYPMSLNAITTGCNQKSNRNPAVEYDEETVFDALDSLRQKGFVRQVELTGSRVEKFRHIARDVLDITTHQLVILAELLLRGPQTVGELRGRAGRMHPFESLEITQNVIDSLIGREPPLVRRVAPASGSRAERFAQLLCPDLHPLDAPAAAAAPASSSSSSRNASELESRLEALESQVESMSRDLAQVMQVIRTQTTRID